MRLFLDFFKVESINRTSLTPFITSLLKSFRNFGQFISLERQKLAFLSGVLIFYFSILTESADKKLVQCQNMILTKIVIKNFRKKYGNFDSKLIPESVCVKKYVNLKKVDFPDGSPTPNPANPSPAVYGPGEFSHDLNNPQSIVNVRNNMIHKISVLSLKKITCPSQGSLLIIKIQTGTRHFAKASLS